MFVIYTCFLDGQIYSPFPLWHIKLTSCFKNLFSTIIFKNKITFLLVYLWFLPLSVSLNREDV